MNIEYLKKHWVRSSDGWVAGVFEGLGKSFRIEPNLLRLIWLVSVFIFGTGLIIYPLLALILPREDKISSYHESKVLGVCLKINRSYGIELGLVRLIAVLSLFCSFGLSMILYLALFFFLPEDNEKLYF